MKLTQPLLLLVMFALCPFAAGCSSLGISLFPTGHFLTDQAEALVERSPRQAVLPRELDSTVQVAHYLQPGDVLLVEPVELDSPVRFPADQKVLTDGTIDLHGFGRVIVAGLTLEAAETLIENAIVDDGEKFTQVNVRLLEPVHRYYVIGEVASPGSYPLTGYETVLDGILAAGGLTSQSAPCDIILARPTPPTSCRVTLPVCYNEITQLGDTSTNYQLQPGDRIFVGSRSCMDELMFWRASSTCERCCRCQTACSDPSIANFRNPLSHFLPSPPLPPNSTDQVQDDSLESDRREDRASVRNGTSATQELPQIQASPRLPSLEPMQKNSAADSSPALPQNDGELEFERPF